MGHRLSEGRKTAFSQNHSGAAPGTSEQEALWCDLVPGRAAGPGLAGPCRLGEDVSPYLLERAQVLEMRRSRIPEARGLELSGRPYGPGNLETRAGGAAGGTPRNPRMCDSAQGLILHGVNHCLPAPEPYSAASPKEFRPAIRQLWG